MENAGTRLGDLGPLPAPAAGGGDFQVRPGEDPVHMLVVLGNAGQCASSPFNGASGPPPLCGLSTNGKTLNR